jgi:hypothetical protein
MKKAEKNQKSKELIQFLQELALQNYEETPNEDVNPEYAHGIFDGKKMIAQLILDRLIEVEFDRDYSRALKQEILQKSRDLKNQIKREELEKKLAEREERRKNSPRFQTLLKREENRKKRAARAAQDQIKKLEKERKKILKLQEQAKQSQEKEKNAALKNESKSQKEAKKLLKEYRIQNTSTNPQVLLETQVEE